MALTCTDVIQRLVDSLAARIRHSVAVDDERGRLIACSRHYGDEDELRIDVVLSRQLPAPAAEYLNSFGIATADAPRSIPAHPSLGLKERRCHPIRDHGQLLGYLWLIGTHTDRLDETVSDCVTQLSAPLRERSLQASEEEQRHRALATALLTRGEASARAAHDLIDQGLLGPHDEIAVIATGATTDPRTLAAVITDTTTRGSDEPPARALPATVDGRGAVLLTGREGVERAAAWWAQEIRRRVRQRNAEDDGVVVGVSNTGRLDQAPDLLRQAVLAAFAAAELPEFPPVLPWRDTGVYGPLMLTAITSPELAVPPQIAELGAGTRTDSLARTAEVFLDTAGDTTAASEQLNIHRTTLYYRLARIENRTGWNLKNGHDRLTLHLGLKMQHLLNSNIPALLQGEEKRRESS
ncbi:PucR family transcriptional regulator [Streptomyces sp. bgisy100]|uniref:PucR family transcriptional regulator n=1 Tax=Streptomyces sp. bgisy100 TaxID=3413783 RepID=UPI003D7524EB